LKRLKEIFPDIEDSVLSYALKIHLNDLESAAVDLMEPDKLHNFRVNVQEIGKINCFVFSSFSLFV
jgi:hypothetical protein